MVWDPVSPDLGSLNENIIFSHTITYEQEDPETMTMVSYPVTIDANEVNPSSINISGATISGYYFDSFNNLITYRTVQGTFPTVTKFNQIQLDNLDEMISYKASTSRTKIFTYTATAKNNLNVVVASQVYTKTVNNDWTSGKNSLQEYVGYASN